MSETKTNYVVASDDTEAWLRFRARCYTDELDWAQTQVEQFNADDQCDPPCKYFVYEMTLTLTKMERPAEGG